MELPLAGRELPSRGSRAPAGNGGEDLIHDCVSECNMADLHNTARGTAGHCHQVSPFMDRYRDAHSFAKNQIGMNESHIGDGCKAVTDNLVCYRFL